MEESNDKTAADLALVAMRARQLCAQTAHTLAGQVIEQGGVAWTALTAGEGEGAKLVGVVIVALNEADARTLIDGLTAMRQLAAAREAGPPRVVPVRNGHVAPTVP